MWVQFWDFSELLPVLRLRQAPSDGWSGLLALLFGDGGSVVLMCCADWNDVRERWARA